MQRMYGSDLWLPIVVCLDRPYLAGPGSHPHQPQQTCSLHVVWQCRRPWRSIFVYIWAALHCQLFQIKESNANNDNRIQQITRHRFDTPSVSAVSRRCRRNTAASAIQQLKMLLKKARLLLLSTVLLITMTSAVTPFLATSGAHEDADLVAVAAGDPDVLWQHRPAIQAIVREQVLTPCSC